MRKDGRVLDRSWHSGAPPNPEAIAEFWARVGQTESCWFWLGSCNSAGYGQVQFNKRMFSTHRLAWTLTHGPIPAGLFVCHHCDTPDCVRPSHLFLGTLTDNVRDCLAKGRNAKTTGLTGEKNHKAKLTWELVRSARDEHRAGASGRSLAVRYGVAFSTMQAVLDGTHWRAAL